MEAGIKGYTAWRKAIWNDPTLCRMAQSKKGERPHRDPRVTWEVIALYGANGHGAFASAEVIAKCVGCDRRTVEIHRKLGFDLGWLKRDGRNNRAVIVSVSLPEMRYSETASHDAVLSPTDAVLHGSDAVLRDPTNRKDLPDEAYQAESESKTLDPGWYFDQAFKRWTCGCIECRIRQIEQPLDLSKPELLALVVNYHTENHA